METLFIGKNSLFLHEVESTNTYAMNLLRNVNAIEGTVVYTDHQTHGRGQRGAVWASKIGQNITVSVVLKPHFLSINDTFFLSKISALAVYDVLTEILPSSQYDIKIKWPNDILVDRQKIAGILIENNFATNSIQHSVMGIGLNINQDEFGDFERTATSLKRISNKDFDRNEVMQLLFSKIEKWYFKLKEQKHEFIDASYLSLLFGLNQMIEFEDVHQLKFKAKLTGVSKMGKLMMELDDKTLKEFDVKEVKFLV